MRSTILEAPAPIDLPLILSPLRRGPRDPCMRLGTAEAWRATRTPQGPATCRFAAAGTKVTVSAWGPGAGWALQRAPELLGFHDEPDAFAPPDDLLRGFARSTRGLRIGRAYAVTETLVPTVIEQKVTSAEAHRSYRLLVLAYGEPAPGPAEPRLMLPPEPRALTKLPYHAYHRAGIERRRAETVRFACSYAHRLEETVAMASDAAQVRLRSLPGVGAWTAAEVARVSYGDPDAVRPGDYHLPKLVGWALAGERDADDARMMELLEPYRGQRGRAARLIEICASRPGRRAPRARLRHIERF